jgi:hypothetical protein
MANNNILCTDRLAQSRVFTYNQYNHAQMLEFQRQPFSLLETSAHIPISMTTSKRNQKLDSIDEPIIWPVAGDIPAALCSQMLWVLLLLLCLAPVVQNAAEEQLQQTLLQGVEDLVMICFEMKEDVGEENISEVTLHTMSELQLVDQVEKPVNLSSVRVLYAYLASERNVVSKPSLGDSLEYTLNHVPLQSVLPQLETVPLAKVLNLLLFW